MEHPTITPKSVERLHADLVCASMEWVDLRDRVARTGERDAQLLAKRDRAMDGMCREGGLLDQYVFRLGVEGGTST